MYLNEIKEVPVCRIYNFSVCGTCYLCSHKIQLVLVYPVLRKNVTIVPSTKTACFLLPYHITSSKYYEVYVYIYFFSSFFSPVEYEMLREKLHYSCANSVTNKKYAKKLGQKESCCFWIDVIIKYYLCYEKSWL